jgi:membrane-bound lytic murein transglycosylase B
MLLGGVTVVAVLVAAAPVGAQTAMPPTAPAEGAGLLPGLDARLFGVAIEYASSPRDMDALRAAQARRDALVQEHAALKAEQDRLNGQILHFSAIEQRAAQDLLQAILDVDRLTALVYTKGNTGWHTSPFLEVEDVFAAERVNQVGTSLTEQLVLAQERAKELRKAARDVTVRFTEQRAQVETRLAQIEQLELPAVEREVQALSVSAAATLAGASVNGLGIPLATLDAYLRAQAILAIERPSCGLQWWMLAGIGRVESNHGRYGGAQPGLRGNVTPPIIGIPLDGSPGVAAIADTDRGAWDFDPLWDRAVGPMQFIPSTWRRYAGDANGDGESNPNNVYDAAAGAARYLCTAAGHLGSDAALTRAYLAYNHSDVYAARVLDLARTYQSIGLPPPVA